MRLTSSKLDKLSTVNNINTMTHIEEYATEYETELQIDYSKDSMNSTNNMHSNSYDGDERGIIEKMILRKKDFSTSNTGLASMNKQPTADSQCQYHEADENDDRNISITI